MAGAIRDHIQVRLPHVAAYKSQMLFHARLEQIKEAFERFFLPFSANPQQPAAAFVDLIHQRQVAVTPPGSEFIDTNRRKFRLFPVNQAPHHCMPNAAIDPIPTGVKDASGLAPGHPSSPTAQEPLIGGRHPFFAAGPLQVLGLHAALWAADPPHGVNEKHLQPKDWDELELSGHSRVVSRAGASALTAAWLAVLARTNIDQDSIVRDSCIPVNKPLERVAAIEDSL
jgi:hypothetical protein